MRTSFSCSYLINSATSTPQQTRQLSPPTTATTMASWEPDDPIQLSDGRLVCRAHRLRICGHCCVDYAYLDEDGDETGSASEEEYIDSTDERYEAYRHLENCMLELHTPEPSQVQAEIKDGENEPLIIPTIGTFAPSSAATYPTRPLRSNRRSMATVSSLRTLIRP